MEETRRQLPVPFLQRLPSSPTQHIYLYLICENLVTWLILSGIGNRQIIIVEAIQTLLKLRLLLLKKKGEWLFNRKREIHTLALTLHHHLCRQRYQMTLGKSVNSVCASVSSTLKYLPCAFIWNLNCWVLPQGHRCKDLHQGHRSGAQNQGHLRSWLGAFVIIFKSPPIITNKLPDPYYTKMPTPVNTL